MDAPLPTSESATAVRPRSPTNSVTLVCKHEDAGIRLGRHDSGLAQDAGFRSRILIDVGRGHDRFICV